MVDICANIGEFAKRINSKGGRRRRRGFECGGRGRKFVIARLLRVPPSKMVERIECTLLCDASSK